MKYLFILGFLVLSFSLQAETSIRQSLFCSSFEASEQQYKSPDKTYDKRFLKTLTYQYWFVPPAPDFEQSGMAPMMNIPKLALKTDKGWLAGISRGEFGGAVTLHKTDGSFEIVTKAVVQDMHFMPFGIVVTEGLAHRHSNRGAIFLLTPSEEDLTHKKFMVCQECLNRRGS